MPIRPVVLVHGYSASGKAFDVWRDALIHLGWPADRLHVVSYESLTNEVSIRDIAEGFDTLLRDRAGLSADEPFDAIVHSTGMLVIRAWLTRDGVDAKRRRRLKHLVALAPATFGSPLAHKGRSWLGALVKGRRQLGPDFLEAGDLVLDGLELASRFTWELTHRDVFGDTPFYDDSPDTPYVTILCGNRGFSGLSGIVNEKGSDGTVRWAGCALNTRKITLDLSADAPANRRVTLDRGTQDDLPVHFVDGLDHGTILSKPTPMLCGFVAQALRIRSPEEFVDFLADGEARFGGVREAMEPWQQFVVRAVDERGDGIRDWNLRFFTSTPGANGRDVVTEFSQSVHPYRADPSLRCFHVNMQALSKQVDPEQRRPLHLELTASSGTHRVWYAGHGMGGADGPARVGSGRSGTLVTSFDLHTIMGTTDPVRLFYPFTTTLVELRLDREPGVGKDMVIRFEGAGLA